MSNITFKKAICTSYVSAELFNIKHMVYKGDIVNCFIRQSSVYIEYSNSPEEYFIISKNEFYSKFITIEKHRDNILENILQL